MMRFLLAILVAWFVAPRAATLGQEPAKAPARRVEKTDQLAPAAQPTPPGKPNRPADSRKANAPADAATDTEARATRDRLFARFKEVLSGVKFKGRFTSVGKQDDALREEEYTIESVQKLPDGDYWLFKARIKYGDRDVTLPMPLEVKWADQTPVITLNDVTLPGLGTFSARVVIDRQKYAGTWSHGDVHGHLFGTIEKTEP